MKINSIMAACLLIAGSFACMSDNACRGGEVSMCCYMNKCVPSSRIGCTGSRLDFYKHLATKDAESNLSEFAKELRLSSEKVQKCDLLGIHCIDYVSELMTDPGAFDLLEGVSELAHISLG